MYLKTLNSFSIFSKICDLKKLRFLKYGFCKNSVRKDEPLTSWTLFWAYLLSLLGGKTTRGNSKSTQKWWQKCSKNLSEVHLSEVTPDKIHRKVLMDIQYEVLRVLFKYKFDCFSIYFSSVSTSVRTYEFFQNVSYLGRVK